MKKAAVITLHYVDNFGSVLQTLATQRVLERLGIDSEVIDYTRANNKYDYLLEETKQRYAARGDIFSRFPFRQLLTLRWSAKYKARKALFDAFRSRYLSLTREYEDLDDLMRDPPKADFYITGSDQTWNGQYNGGVLPEYFLAFAPEGKTRFALSASFGKTDFTDDEIAEMKPYLHAYKGISVRESSGLSVLARAGYSDALHVLDLSAKEWDETLGIGGEDEKKYILLYQLNANAKMEAFAKKLAADEEMEVRIISGAYRKAPFANAKLFAGVRPEEFVRCVRNASHVVTDSFHGTAFSLNYGRDVYVFSPPKFSTRLLSILSLVGEEGRIADEKSDWRSFAPIDDAHVQEVFAHEREKAERFCAEKLR